MIAILARLMHALQTLALMQMLQLEQLVQEETAVLELATLHLETQVFILIAEAGPLALELAGNTHLLTLEIFAEGLIAESATVDYAILTITQGALLGRAVLAGIVLQELH